MEQGRPTSTSLLFTLLLASPVHGQFITGSIAGTVTDAIGGILAGAGVTITSPALMGGFS